jgi:replication initiation and membrane attachment protein DnaB
MVMKIKMSARDLIHNHIDNTVKNLIHAIASKYNLNEKEVYSLWSSSSSSFGKESSISSVNTTDLSPERLTKSTVAELKALCKTKGVKCTGKKEELVSRLLGKEGDESEVVEKTKKQKPEKKTASSSLSVIQKLAPTIPTIAIRKNQYGNLVHPDTQFVFDRIHEVVIGKQGENGKVLDLTDEDIQTCKRLKMQYKLPGNLDKNIKF